jgi:predicted nucleic acid-binding protein
MGSEKKMIHLDANFLIGALDRSSPVGGFLQNWIQQGEKFAVSSIAWAEFLNGPVTPDQVRISKFLLEGGIVSFGAREAETAAELFNRSGRKRGSHADCFIAATAICARVSLATRNTKDFQSFVPLGLRLA